MGGTSATAQADSPFARLFATRQSGAWRMHGLPTMAPAELASLQVDDMLEEMGGGATLLVRRSKTDGEGCGEIVYLARDTVALVRAWLARSGITEGRLFRSVAKGGRLGEGLDPSQVPRIFKAMADRAGLPRPPRPRRGGSVPPRPRLPARSRLSRGQCRGAAHGVAAHPAAGLAGRRGRGRGRETRPVGGARARACGAARSRHPRPRRDSSPATPGSRGYRRAGHSRRTQHGKRRFRRHRRLGPLRPGRHRDAGTRLRRGTRLLARRTRGVGRCPIRARRQDLPTSTSTAKRSGATSPPPSGPTALAATKCSRNGCLTENAPFLVARSAPEEVQHFTDTARRIGAILSMAAAKTRA